MDPVLRIVNEYNNLYAKAIEAIDSTISQLPSSESEQQISSEFSQANLARINEIQELIRYTPGYDNY